LKLTAEANLDRARRCRKCIRHWTIERRALVDQLEHELSPTNEYLFCDADSDYAHYADAASDDAGSGRAADHDD
jgi:hypothetical protein